MQGGYFIGPLLRGFSIQITAEESQWFNSNVDKQSELIINKLEKVISDAVHSLKFALSWCICTEKLIIKFLWVLDHINQCFPTFQTFHK